jgi:DNA invertase Pin-like site-specific DNA recombinase
VINVLRNENEWQEVCAMMMLGYARVSTNEQDTSTQVSALKSAGCGKIFFEKASGGRWDRPELHRLLDQLRKGDIVVCCRLDRISRSVRDILMIMERIKEAEAGFKSLTEAIDTTTVSGTKMMQLIAVFAQFERSALAERTKAGLDAARKQGRLEGDGQNFGPINRMKLSRWYLRGSKLPPTPRGFLLFTRPRCRGFWLGGCRDYRGKKCRDLVSFESGWVHRSL